MNWKNRFIFCLHKVHNLLSRKKTERPAFKKCLIVSTTALGDTLWGTPVIESLRKTHSDIFIGVLVASPSLSIFENNPHVNEVYVYEKMFSLYQRLRKEEFDTVIVFHASQRCAIAMAGFLKADRVIGTKNMNKDLDFLFTDLVDNKWEIHEIQRRYSLVELFNLRHKDVKMSLYPTLADKICVDEMLSALDMSLSDGFVIIHPGAKDLYKRWPITRFIELCHLIKEKTNFAIILTGSFEELPLADSICREVPEVVSMMGLLSLKELCVIIEKSHCFVSGDTGPMHLAFLNRAKSVSLFCATNPSLNGPLDHQGSHTILKVPQTCSPCFMKACQDPFCLKQISASEVFEKMFVVN